MSGLEILAILMLAVPAFAMLWYVWFETPEGQRKIYEFVLKLINKIEKHH